MNADIDEVATDDDDDDVGGGVSHGLVCLSKIITQLAADYQQ